MCNHLPNVNADDNGTWRRIRVVEFASKFVAHPDPNDVNEFPIDLDLAKKFEKWRPHFMGMLLHYYRIYLINGLQEPDEVLACTLEYQRNNDFIADFIAASVEIVPDYERACVGMDDLYEEFKEWAKNENLSLRIPRRKDIQVHLEKRFGKCIRRGGTIVFKNIKLKQHTNDSIHDDEEVQF